MGLKVLSGLILINLVWSFYPLLGKWVLAEVHPFQVAWLRYSSAWLTLLLFGLFLRLKRVPGQRTSIESPVGGSPRASLFFIGILTFAIGPVMMMVGLNLSWASENAILVALEPCLAAGLAWILLRESLNRIQGLSFFVAILGLVFLTGESFFRGNFRGWGNLILLASIAAEAIYSVYGKMLLRYYHPLKILTVMMGVGVFFQTLLLLFTVGFPRWGEISQTAALSILFMGPMGTAVGYLYWIYALKNVTVATVSLTLLIQPVVGMLAGILILNEQMAMGQLLGGALILSAVVLPWLVTMSQQALKRVEPAAYKRSF